MTIKETVTASDAVDRIKRQIAEGVSATRLDFSELDSAISATQSEVNETPTPETPTPETTPAPVEPTPAEPAPFENPPVVETPSFENPPEV